MKANASFGGKGEVVNYAHTYDRPLLFLSGKQKTQKSLQKCVAAMLSEQNNKNKL